MKKLTVSILGLGDRGLNIYAQIIHAHPDMFELISVCDIRKERVERAKKLYTLDEQHCFTNDADFFAKGKLSDVLFLCTMDRAHCAQAVQALALGYDLILEKPVSENAEDCLTVLNAANTYGRRVLVCHVLRYTPFYRKIKEIIDSGLLGRVMSIQGREDVGYYHQAHSFVRGNWRNDIETSPMILQKCCHDMDIYVWLTGKKCKELSSFGQLSWFKPQNAPQGSAEYCMNGCAVRDTCPYDCEKIYITDPGTGIRYGNQWPSDVVVTDPTEEKLRKALPTSPYGRCVYHCDNNVVDHQLVNLQLEDDIIVSHSMCAFSKECNRYIHIMGTKAELTGNMNAQTIRIQPFDSPDNSGTLIDLHDSCSNFSHHGGGDEGLVLTVADYLLHGVSDISLTSLEDSIESHLMCFAAEKSRKSGGQVQILHEN